MKSYKNKEHMIVDQEVPGSRPGGGTITLNDLTGFSENCFIQIDHYRPPTRDP